MAVFAQAIAFVSPLFWPDTVLDVVIQGDRAWIISLIPTLTDPPRLFTTLPLRLNRAVAMFPLFWGLTLATPGRGLGRRLLLGTALLLPIAIGMILLSTQFEFALNRTHLPTLTRMPPPYFILSLPDTPTAYYFWGVGRQLATLILPMISPLLVWLALHGSFLRDIPLGGLLKRRTLASPPSPKLPGDSTP